VAVQESTQAPPGFPANPGPSEEAVRQQLAKVLTSPQFVNSPNLCNFRQFIVEKTLTGEAATIKGYTVATQVLGRMADFDPNLDPIVRIQAGRLRRALEKYCQKQGLKRYGYHRHAEGRLRAGIPLSFPAGGRWRPRLSNS
jgi:hypothetical protein